MTSQQVSQQDLAEFATKAMASNLISPDKLKETLDSPKTVEVTTKFLLDLLPKNQAG